MIQVELQDTMGSDAAIADAAWTSSLDYQKKQNRSAEDVKRVVNMLADSKHSVPFESVIFRFWIKMPIQTDRQHMTHRLQSASGLSGRYRTMPSEYLEIPEEVEFILDKISSHSYQKYYDLCEAANLGYNRFIRDAKLSVKAETITEVEFKRVREFYRGVLPLNNMVERVSIFNLRSFANYIKLRSKSDAQPEIRKVANLMLMAVKEKSVCPTALEALERNAWNI